MPVVRSAAGSTSAGQRALLGGRGSSHFTTRMVARLLAALTAAYQSSRPSLRLPRARVNPDWNASPFSKSIQRGVLLSLVVVAALMLIAYPSFASAQTSASSGASDTMASGVASPGSASTPKATKKMQRKAAHNARQAELKKLEDNGYEPSEDRANYPNDIQNAEKKANGVPAASTP